MKKPTNQRIRFTTWLLTLAMILIMLPAVTLPAVAAEGAVASVTIGNTTTTYPTLNDAIVAAKDCTTTDNAVVKLLSDIDLGNTKQLINSGVFTLDLNGHTITSSNDDTLRVYNGVSNSVAQVNIR